MMIIFSFSVIYDGHKVPTKIIYKMGEDSDSSKVKQWFASVHFLYRVRCFSEFLKMHNSVIFTNNF